MLSFSHQFFYFTFVASLKRSDAGADVEDNKEVPEMMETQVVKTNGKDSGLVPDADLDYNHPESCQNTFSYEQLKAKSDNPVTGIDFKQREVSFI